MRLLLKKYFTRGPTRWPVSGRQNVYQCDNVFSRFSPSLIRGANSVYVVLQSQVVCHWSLETLLKTTPASGDQS